MSHISENDVFLSKAFPSRWAVAIEYIVPTYGIRAMKNQCRGRCSALTNVIKPKTGMNALHRGWPSLPNTFARPNAYDRNIHNNTIATPIPTFSIISFMAFSIAFMRSQDTGV